ncbi:MAG: hypothetical protein WDA18_04620 [Candidatus Ratteibacteria bacterium]
MEKRVCIVIFDMLAGHWGEHAIVPATGLPPPNVIGYANAGLLPVFKEMIDQGVFVYSWNNGICNTPYGQKYLASGFYQGVKATPSLDPYWCMEEGLSHKTILTACMQCYPHGKVGSFGSDAWMQSGWWKAKDITCGWGSYFSDFLTSQYAFQWMMNNPDWKMSLIYLAQYDQTGNCPLYKKNASYTEDKHHSLLYLDKLLWMIQEFLKENGWWEETFLFIGSDHGCHYGCDVAVEEGRERGIKEEDLRNYCSNHQPPYDCHIWDFTTNRALETRSDCARRTTFIINGGALSSDLRNRVVPSGEIIDFPATIAKLMGIDFSSEGKSVI